MIRSRALPALLVSLLLGFTWLTASAQETKRTFDIPAGKAETTLKAFATQAGTQFFFSAEKVGGVRTNAVKGRLEPREALDLLVADTGLTVVQDAKTGALTVNRGSVPNAERVVRTEAATPKAPGKIEEGRVVLETFEVTGSRIPLNTGERPVQPVFTMNALDIERTGASSLGQLFRYMPAVSNSAEGFHMESTNGGTSGGFVLFSNSRVTAQLRGGTDSATLLLVDGRRVARTGNQGGGGTGFDLGGIPLSAVERVEVLLDGASAIYGADAINGVINVILKKRYSGTELRLTYDNTFDKDAATRTVSLTHGFSRGKLSGLVTLSTSDNNILLLADRELTASFDRTIYGGVSNNSQPALLIGGAGSINRASGLLPGLSTTVASIPTNSTGQSLTVASYAGAGTPFGGINPGIQGALGYLRSRSGYVRLAYEHSDRLQVSASVRIGDSMAWDNGRYKIASNVTLPAGYPGNPFGVPIRLNKVFYDLRPIYLRNFSRNDEYHLAVSGKLAGDWRYELSGTHVRGINHAILDRFPDGRIVAGALQAGALTAAIAAGRTPTLIYDSRTQSPNSSGSLDELFVTQSSGSSDYSQDWTFHARADGSMYSLPAGDVRAVVGAEFRHEGVSFPDAVNFTPWPSIPQREVLAAYAEVLVPIVAPKQRWPLIHRLDVNLAIRTEDYNDFGRSTTPRYGVAWRPVAPILLRASYGEGFLAPNLSLTSRETVTRPFFWANNGNAIDPLRGNQNYGGGTYTSITGGNPNLKAQRSENWTYGIVVDVPKVPGLSLSFDWFENNYTDRIGTILTLADSIRYFPDSVSRGPNLPGDQPGWPGPVVSFDQRPRNIAVARFAGYSFGARWNLSTTWGDFALTASGEKTLTDESRVLPDAPPTATVNKRFRPMRITSSLFWTRDGWDAGVTSIYGGRYWVNSTNETLSPSRWTDDVMRWDVNAGYDFGRNKAFGAKGSSWWQRALHDTKLRVTVINVFDTEPPLDALGFFSGSVIDIRLRRYVIDFTKRF